jgi:hypothetical protein
MAICGFLRSVRYQRLKHLDFVRDWLSAKGIPKTPPLKDLLNLNSAHLISAPQIIFCALGAPICRHSHKLPPWQCDSSNDACICGKGSIEVGRSIFEERIRPSDGATPAPARAPFELSPVIGLLAD